MPPRLRSSATLREPARRPGPRLEPLPFSEAPATKVNNVDDYGDYLPYSLTMIERESIKDSVKRVISVLPLDDQRGIIMELAWEFGILADSRIARLLARLEDRVADYVPPSNGITSAAELRAARNLASTYRALIKLQKAKNLPPHVRPHKVAEAERLITKFHDAEKKRLEPPRPRGRPRKLASSQSGHR